jgi:mRNA interferase MazF
MVVSQGDLFWAHLGPVRESSPAGRRPVVVVQSDLFNETRINTVVVVALTTSERRRDLPGNVRFRRGEANLPRTCAANVTQLWTLDRSRLVEKIGAIGPTKREALLQGLALVMGIG